jgi:hypothetical protein
MIPHHALERPASDTIECAESLARTDDDSLSSVSFGSDDHGRASPSTRLPCAATPPRDLSLMFRSCSSTSLDEMDSSETMGRCGAGSPASHCASPVEFDAMAVTQLSSLLELQSGGRYSVHPDYMNSVYNGSMVPKWRQQLVEWMEEVVREFRLCDATFFAAVQLLDRVLSSKRVASHQLQAFALTCCIICSKVHDSKYIRMVRACAA